MVSITSCMLPVYLGFFPFHVDIHKSTVYTLATLNFS